VPCLAQAATVSSPASTARGEVGSFLNLMNLIIRYSSARCQWPDLCVIRRASIACACGTARPHLDAPDLSAPTVPDSGSEKAAISSRIAGMNGVRGGGAASIRRNGKADTVTIKPVLDPDGSAALRDQLLTDLDRLISADAAAIWAHQIMAAKNSLAAADSRARRLLLLHFGCQFNHPPDCFGTRRDVDLTAVPVVYGPQKRFRDPHLKWAILGASTWPVTSFNRPRFAFVGLG